MGEGEGRVRVRAALPQPMCCSSRTLTLSLGVTLSVGVSLTLGVTLTPRGNPKPRGHPNPTLTRGPICCSWLGFGLGPPFPPPLGPGGRQLGSCAACTVVRATGSKKEMRPA